MPARAPGAYRLRLEADTRGTRDDEVKSVGVGSRCALTLGPGTRVRVVLDWTPAANASYLAGAIVLSPHATTGDPAAGADWLSVGYVGVPPGNHARLLVVSRVRGQTRTLFDDGFPATNRVGRPIGRVELEVAWREEAVEVREDGRVVHRAGSGSVPFTRAHVYLQLASHSNFPARPVHFEHLRVSQGEEKPYGAFPSAPGCEERAHEAEGAAPARR